MTIVEFFSDVAIDNIVTTLANRPERVIFVGESDGKACWDGRLGRLKRFFKAAGVNNTEIDYRTIENSGVLSDIVNVLDGIVREYPDCQFDLTGGNELCLVAAGVIFERYGNRQLNLHQYDIQSGQVFDCDGNNHVVSSVIPPLTVEQTILLHGGSIVRYPVRENGYYPWNFNEEFRKDVRAMWEICSSDRASWNTQVTMLGDMQTFKDTQMSTKKPQPKPAAMTLASLIPAEFAPAQSDAESKSPAEKDLTLSIPLKKFLGYHCSLRNVPLPGKFDKSISILRKLENAGLLSDIHSAEDNFRVTFKNEKIKRALAKAGTILELYTCLVAGCLKDDYGNQYYNDSKVGVFIDWDGRSHEKNGKEVDTENEIDVVLMRGLVPVFISCKNGTFDDDELYKLNTVARRFGGPYAKRVLVASASGSASIGDSKKGEGKKGYSKESVTTRYLNDRAKEMDIKIIWNVSGLSETAFGEQLKSLPN